MCTTIAASSAGRPVAAVLCLLVTTTAAHAQGTGTEWTRGSTLNVLAGVSTDGSEAGLAAGGAMGWEVTPRAGVETTFTWYDRGREAEAFSGDVALLFNLVAPRRAVPFVKAGGGVFLASFNREVSPIPDFYQRRIDPDSFGTNATFTDGAITLGGGIKIWLGDRWVLRPEVDARLVVRGWHGYWLTAGAVRIAYYFVDRPTTDRRLRP